MLTLACALPAVAVAAATCGISGQVLTCSAATLSNGGSFTVTIPVVGQSGTVLNTATVNSSVPDPTPANNAASAATTVVSPRKLPAAHMQSCCCPLCRR